MGVFEHARDEDEKRIHKQPNAAGHGGAELHGLGGEADVVPHEGDKLGKIVVPERRVHGGWTVRMKFLSVSEGKKERRFTGTARVTGRSRSGRSRRCFSMSSFMSTAARYSVTEAP